MIITPHIYKTLQDNIIFFEEIVSQKLDSDAHMIATSALRSFEYLLDIIKSMEELQHDQIH